jgi:hypothetical protein
MRRCLISVAASCLFVGVAAYPAVAQSTVTCEQAGHEAEQRFAVPSGLLLAIGRVESGRWDAGLGRVVPWPWAIDVDGSGRLFDSSAAAIQATESVMAAGRHSIDVGCFQINLQQHPDAFAGLGQAFDPRANATYAARFLTSLRLRLGNWQDAVAAYHSATPDLGAPYRQRVFAAWTGQSENIPVYGAQLSSSSGVHVWGPSAPGTAPSVIVLHASPTLPLPRVITLLPRVVTPGG